MREVLFTRDLEPITVIDFKPYFYEFLAQNGEVRVPVYRPVSSWAGRDGSAFKSPMLTTVTIVAHGFYYLGETRFLFITADEASAMLLKSVFLPGQRQELNDVKNEMFLKGFYNAFGKFADFGD